MQGYKLVQGQKMIAKHFAIGKVLSPYYTEFMPANAVSNVKVQRTQNALGKLAARANCDVPM